MKWYALTYAENIVPIGDFPSIDEADEYYDAKFRGVEDRDGGMWLFSEESLSDMRDKITQALRVGKPMLTERDVWRSLKLTPAQWDELPDTVRQFCADSYNAGD
jgi:hypothetical protein